MLILSPPNPSFHSPTLVDEAPDLLLSKTKGKSEGRGYTHLSKIQRLGRLFRIIALLILNSFGIARSQANSAQILVWHDEFKQGRKVNICKTSDINLLPAGSPVASPTESPIGSPTGSPVASPTESPIGSPVCSPVASPIALPDDSPFDPLCESPIGSPAILIINEEKTPQEIIDLENGEKISPSIINFKPSKMEQVPSTDIYAFESKIVNPHPKYPLTPLSTFEKEGLLPKFKIKHANAIYYFSDTFILGNTARVMFVEVDGCVHQRIIYQSNSQACWRVMPNIGKHERTIYHIGKGKIESDTQLPLEITLALHALKYQKPTLKSLLAQNLVKTEQYPKEQNKIWEENIVIKALMGTAADPKFFVKMALIPRTPHPQDIEPQLPGAVPDFSAPLKEISIDVPHYGKLNAKLFSSKDGNLQYLYYEASDGKVFIGGVEQVVDNPINEFGVRETCLDLYNLDAPLLDYYEQIPKAYLPSNVFSSRYISDKYYCAWNYIREMPLVQLYYDECGRSSPSKI